LLEAQLRTCDELISLSRREQQALMNNQASALPEAVATKERCVRDLAGLEEAIRETLTAWEVSTEPDLDTNAPPSLTRLLQTLPVEDRLPLQDLQQSLWSQVRTLRILSRAITVLIKSSLAQADAWVSVLSDVTRESPAYDARGQPEIGNIASSQVLDQQA